MRPQRAPGDGRFQRITGEAFTLGAQFTGLGVAVQQQTGTTQQGGRLGDVGLKPETTETVVGLAQTWLGCGRVAGDQFDNAGELLDLQERMPQAAFRDHPPRRFDHPARRGLTPAERLQHRLAPGRRHFHRGRVGRDAQQPNHIQTPPAGPRHRVGSPQRRQRRPRQDRVHATVFPRSTRRRQRIIQRHLAVPDPAEAGQTSRPDRVRLGFPGGVIEFSQLDGRRSHRSLHLVQAFRVSQHRKLTVEAGRPCR